MKKIILLLALGAPFLLNSQNLYFPPLVGQTWETVTPASLGWCEPAIDTLFDFLDGNDTKAFIVLKDGKIAIEKYFDTFTRDSIWYWASAGKSLTAFTAGIAKQEGYLNLDLPSYEYLGAGWTSCDQTDEAKITVWNQLTMTSGLKDGVADPSCFQPSCLQCIAPPGTRWAYHNAPYTLLDGVIEDATGQTLNTYITQKIKSKTGMTGLFVMVDNDNVFFSTARSMARFGLLVLNKGKWANTPVMTDTAYFNQMTRPSQAINKSYGYLWWLNGQESYMLPGFQFVFPGMLFPSAPPDMVSALGKNGQSLNVVPSTGIVVVRMGNSLNNGLVDAQLSEYIWQRLSKVFCNASAAYEPGAAPQLDIAPNPVADVLQLNAEAGTFTLSDALGRSWPAPVEGDRLSVAHLPQGVYFLSIDTEKGRKTLRFVKN